MVLYKCLCLYLPAEIPLLSKCLLNPQVCAAKSCGFLCLLFLGQYTALLAMVTRLVKEGRSSRMVAFHNSHWRKPMLLLRKQTPTLSQDTIYACKKDDEPMGFKAFSKLVSLTLVLTVFFQPLCTNQTAEQESGDCVCIQNKLLNNVP